MRDDSGDSAQCISCKKIIKCNGGSTKGLHTHQKTHGVEILKKVAPSISSSPSTQSSVSDQSQIHTHHFSADNSVKKRKITDYFPNDNNSLPAILSRMTALDGLPFSVFVTSPDLRRCFQALGHDLPKSSNTVRVQVCNYADAMRDRLTTELQQLKVRGRRFSLTFDEWTSTKNRRYLNLNLHGIDCTEGSQSWRSLGLVRIRGSFSAESCVQALKDKLQQFQLNLETDIVSITTDGCSMMVRVGRLIGPNQQLCLAHGIQLAVMDTLYKTKLVTTPLDEESQASDATALNMDEDSSICDECGCGESDSESEDDEEQACGDPFRIEMQPAGDSSPASFSDSKIGDVIQKVRNIVKLFKRSPLKNEILQSHVSAGRKANTDGAFKELHLILDSKTRWSSLSDMLDRILEVKPALQKALIDLQIPDPLTEDDFQVVTQVARAMKPLRVAVEALCRRDANLLTAGAILKFALEDLHQQSTPLSVKLEAAVRRRTVDERTTEASSIIRYLHNPQAQEVKKSVVKKYCVNLLTRLQTFDCEEASSDGDSDALVITHATPMSTMEDRLNEAIAITLSVKMKSTTAPSGLSSLLTKELAVAEQSGKRGYLLDLAYQHLLTVPPTSVEAERVFSSAGFLCTKLRSRLGDKTLDNLCFLRFQLKPC